MKYYHCEKCKEHFKNGKPIKQFEGKYYSLDCWNIGNPNQMETIEPLELKRPKVSEMVIQEFAKVLDSQNEKGFKKYNTTIDDAVDYDWKLMALEESTDLQQYLVKEIMRLREENKQLSVFRNRVKDLLGI